VDGLQLPTARLLGNQAFAGRVNGQGFWHTQCIMYLHTPSWYLCQRLSHACCRLVQTLLPLLLLLLLLQDFLRTGCDLEVSLKDLRLLLPTLSLDAAAIAGQAVALSQWHQVMHSSAQSNQRKRHVCRGVASSRQQARRLGLMRCVILLGGSSSCSSNDRHNSQVARQSSARQPAGACLLH
jgi:hypothetical protein